MDNATKTAATRIVLKTTSTRGVRWVRSYVFRALQGCADRKYVGAARAADGRAYYEVSLSAPEVDSFFCELEGWLSDYPDVSAADVAECC